VRSKGERPERQFAKSNKASVQLHWYFGYNQPGGMGKI
jgi:hypothetical protein